METEKKFLPLLLLSW